MKIDHIRCRIVSHPLPAPLRPAWAPGRSFEHTACTLVEVTTDEGLTGLGALPHYDPIGLLTVAELVAPYILGKDPFAVERISPILRHAVGDPQLVTLIGNLPTIGHAPPAFGQRAQVSILGIEGICINVITLCRTVDIVIVVCPTRYTDGALATYPGHVGRGHPRTI